MDFQCDVSALLFSKVYSANLYVVLLSSPFIEAFSRRNFSCVVASWEIVLSRQPGTFHSLLTTPKQEKPNLIKELRSKANAVCSVEHNGQFPLPRSAVPKSVSLLLFASEHRT